MSFALCVFLREAEVCKPKSNWELRGVLELVAGRIPRQEKNPAILFASIAKLYLNLRPWSHVEPFQKPKLREINSALSEPCVL